ncbi:MAG: hypothetical protein LIO74_01345 [Ruminococcus sp.]|nr:hypothetical protein [Ruminococcus sp.]
MNSRWKISACESDDGTTAKENTENPQREIAEATGKGGKTPNTHCSNRPKIYENRA